MYVEMQGIVRDEGGVVVPLFNNYLFAMSTKVLDVEIVGALELLHQAVDNRLAVLLGDLRDLFGYLVAGALRASAVRRFGRARWRPSPAAHIGSRPY